ncbi:MAG: hypothetical protein KKB50_01830 [Planctomycetes bacterium]|nr:hypothetical protein [Planctomycetota bacterium]
MQLESGPAAYDRNYNLVIMLVGVFLGAYFLYDYHIGYPKKNLEAARKALAPLLGVENVPQTLSETPTQPETQARVAELSELAKSKPINADDVRQAFGQPLFTMPDEDGSGTLEHFVSAYGIARVPIVRGRVDPKQIYWMPWEKSKEEIRLQLYCALVAFAFALYMFTRVYRAAALRVVIDDQGMTYAKRRIPFENMVRLCDYSRKGWVDLYYKHGPQERKLRIDNQKVRKFDEIIDTLCQGKGFEDPRKAAEEAEATAAPEPAPEAPESTDPAETAETDATDADRTDRA